MLDTVNSRLQSPGETEMCLHVLIYIVLTQWPEIKIG